MTQLEETIIHIDDFFREHRIEYVIIGGISVILHGLQRTTQDVDITISTDIESLQPIAEKILKRFTAKKPEPIKFFEQFFVLPVIDEHTSLGIDISAGVGNFDKNVIRRAVKKKIAGREIPCCSIEDLIIYKLAASRERDKSDVDFLFQLYRNKIDKKYLLEIAYGFVEVERSDIFETVKKMFL